MNVKKLKKIIDLIPEDAKIYVEADHGQLSEIAHNILFCTDDCGYKRLPFLVLMLMIGLLILNQN